LIWDCSSGDRPKDYTSEKKDQKNIQMTPKNSQRRHHNILLNKG
jgi:hypothetical protein